MYERDTEMLGDIIAAIYAGDDHACIEKVEALRLGAADGHLRDLAAAAKLRSKPIRSGVADPNPQALPQPGVKPGWPVAA